MQVSLPHNHTATSIAAAHAKSGSAKTDEALVFEWIRSQGIHGSTCDAAEEQLGLSHQGCSARCNGLERRGLIERSGERRPTRSGCMAFVYVASEFNRTPTQNKTI